MERDEDRAKSAFGNVQDEHTYEKAVRSKESYLKRFGDDSNAVYHLAAKPVPVISDALGVRNLVLSGTGDAFDIKADAAAAPMPPETSATQEDAHGAPLIVGNIRMGFGHYRIAMAMASAAHAMGYTPYWMDLASFKGSTGSAAIAGRTASIPRARRSRSRFPSSTSSSGSRSTAKDSASSPTTQATRR